MPLRDGHAKRHLGLDRNIAPRRTAGRDGLYIYAAGAVFRGNRRRGPARAFILCQSPPTPIPVSPQTARPAVWSSGEQIVEIPLDEFKLRRPYIESLRIRGRFSRQLYIDELGLVDDAQQFTEKHLGAYTL